MRCAKGEFITFLDDDDEWMPNKLEIQVPVIENSSADVGLVYGWMEYFKDGKSAGVRSPKLRGDVFVEMLDKQAIGGCPTTIIKREVVDRIGYFDESLPRGNDGDYWRRVTKQYHVDFVPQIVAKVSISSPNRISTDSKESLRNHIKSARIRMSKFRAEFNQYPEAEARLLYNIMKTHVRINEYKEAFKCLIEILRILNLRFDLWVKFLKKIMKR